MTKGTFLKGAMILTAAGLLTKLLGAVYRIPMARMLEGEGMGLYQMAYPLYTMILALSTAGLPVAISLLVAERLAAGDQAGARRVLRVALGMVTVVGLTAAAGLFWGAPWLARDFLGDPRAYHSLTALTPALFFAGILSAYRGYYQGFQRMGPTAASQIVEQGVRVVTIFAAIWLLLPYGIEFAAAGATFGAVTGAAAGALALWFYDRRFIGRHGLGAGAAHPGISPGRVLCRLIVLGLPVGLGGMVMPLMQALDAAQIPRGLQAAGLAVQEATTLFGEFSGMASTVIYLPAILTTALAASLVPAVSEAMAQRRLFLANQKVELALKTTSLLSWPSAVGLLVLAEPLAGLLFGQPRVGLAIAWLAPAVLFMGLAQTGAGALQGLGKTYLPVLTLLVGAGVKIIFNGWAVPLWGILGAALGTLGAFLATATLNLLLLVREKILWPVPWAEIIGKPMAASAIMGVFVWKLYAQLHGWLPGSSLAALAAVGCGAVLYGLALLLVGSLSWQDVRGMVRYLGQ